MSIKTDLKQLNEERIDRIKASESGMSYGMEVLINEIKQAQQPVTWDSVLSSHITAPVEVTVYFTWVTDNRLMAHIIVNNRLQRLVIPEAGHRLYANGRDGYQANGGGYSKPFAILERMVDEAKKHIDIQNWQDFIKAEVIA